VCADLDAELRKFNGQTDHLHLLAHYPPSLACRCWSTGSKAYPLAGRASSTHRDREIPVGRACLVPVRRRRLLRKALR
jgi:hypothetical protein